MRRPRRRTGPLGPRWITVTGAQLRVGDELWEHGNWQFIVRFVPTHSRAHLLRRRRDGWRLAGHPDGRHRVIDPDGRYRVTPRCRETRADLTRPILRPWGW